VRPHELAAARGALEAACEEMGAALQRSAFSPNIKERRDFSCAVFDEDARLVAQAEHIPVHLGSMEASVQAVLDAFPQGLDPGDAAVTNDPYRGGTHVPDVTMVVPVHAGQRLLGFAATRAHHADMGGVAPGSMPAGATDVHQEGLVIAPTRVHRRGRAVRAVLGRIASSTRAPGERRADLEAQRAACQLGAARVAEVARRWGAARLARAVEGVLQHSQRWLERELAAIPPGTWEAEDALDDDGVTAEPVRLRVRVARRGRKLDIDFAGSVAQRPGNVNAPLAVTRSASYYVVKLLTDPAIPSNAGLFAPVRVRAPEGSVLNPRSPAAVSAGNVETSSRVVDLLLKALAPALPERVPAASQGTMNNVAMGGAGLGRAWAYYETLAGGEGACPWRAGMSGVHTHMTNTRNTPVEALEHAYPLRVLRYTLRRGSGGRGARRGGEGLVREVLLLEPTVVSLLTDRRSRSPWGLAGGRRGARGRNEAVVGGRASPLPSKTTRSLPAGAVLRVATPGGGGWGTPPRRRR
jgi:N-methylhydantoinase B